MSKTKDETLPEISAAERAMLRAAAASQDANCEPAGIECFNCGYACKYGELSCPKCLTMFSNGANTRKLKDKVTLYQPDQKWPTGDVFVATQQAITFCIDGQELTLPMANMLTIGRSSEVPGDKGPDVSLSAFNAGDHGVSRQHLQVSRQRDMIYISDMGSSNGTYLNGRRLAPNQNRLLRNGDELQLGYLKIRVAFTR